VALQAQEVLAVSALILFLALLHPTVEAVAALEATQQVQVKTEVPVVAAALGMQVLQLQQEEQETRQTLHQVKEATAALVILEHPAAMTKMAVAEVAHLPPEIMAQAATLAALVALGKLQVLQAHPLRSLAVEGVAFVLGQIQVLVERVGAVLVARGIRQPMLSQELQILEAEGEAAVGLTVPLMEMVAQAAPALSS
jgi:hypothetical protein